MVEFFVVKRIVGLSNINLLPRVLDARHLVGHLGRLLNILGVCKIPVSPVSTIQRPANAVKPDRLISQLLRNLLRCENDRRCSIARRTNVQPLPGSTDRIIASTVIRLYLWLV